MKQSSFNKCFTNINVRVGNMEFGRFCTWVNADFVHSFVRSKQTWLYRAKYFFYLAKLNVVRFIVQVHFLKVINDCAWWTWDRNRSLRNFKWRSFWSKADFYRPLRSSCSVFSIVCKGRHDGLFHFFCFVWISGVNNPMTR